MKEAREISKQLILSYLLMFLTAPLGYFIRILFAKSLPIEYYGLIYSALGLIALISIFNDLGFTEALYYFIPRFLSDNNWKKAKTAIFYAFMMQTSSALILTIFSFVFADKIATNYFHLPQASFVIKIFSLQFLIYNIDITLVSITKGMKKTALAAFYNFIRLSFILLFSLLMIYVIKPYNLIYYLAIAWVLGYFIATIILFIIVIIKYPQLVKAKLELDKKLYKDMFKYAKYVVIGSGAMIVLSRTDIAAITYIKGVSEVALYTTALSVINIIPMFLNPINALLHPVASQLDYKKQYKKLKFIIETFYNLMLPLSLPFIGLFVMFPKLILRVLFTESFLPSYLGIIIFSIFVIFNLAYSFNFVLLAAFGLVKQRTKIMYIAALLNLVLDIILVYYLGYIGAVITTSLIWMFMAISTTRIIMRKVKFSIRWLSIIKSVFAGVVFIAIVSLLKWVLRLNPYLEAIIVTLFSLVIYFSIIIIIKAIDLKEIIGLLKISLPDYVIEKGKKMVRRFYR